MKKFKEMVRKEKPPFKELKKSIMPKWKLGSKYIEGFKDFKSGRSKNLSIYELVDYDASIIYEDGEDTIYKVTLTLKDINTKKYLKIDQDDRYGKYALLDKSRKANIVDTYEEAKSTVEVLEKIFKHIK